MLKQITRALLSIATLSACAATDSNGARDDKADGAVVPSAHVLAFQRCMDVRDGAEAPDQSSQRAIDQEFHACVVAANTAAGPAIDATIDDTTRIGAVTAMPLYERDSAEFCDLLSRSAPDDVAPGLAAKCRGRMSERFARLIDAYVKFGDNVEVREIDLDTTRFQACYVTFDVELARARTIDATLTAQAHRSNCIREIAHRVDTTWIARLVEHRHISEVDATNTVRVAHEAAMETLLNGCGALSRANHAMTWDDKNLAFFACDADGEHLIGELLLDTF